MNEDHNIQAVTIAEGVKIEHDGTIKRLAAFQTKTLLNYLPTLTLTVEKGLSVKTYVCLDIFHVSRFEPREVSCPCGEVAELRPEMVKPGLNIPFPCSNPEHWLVNWNGGPSAQQANAT